MSEMDRREFADPDYLDPERFWSFRGQERLRVHEGRTLADRDSRVMAVRRHYKNLLVMRGERDQWRRRA